MQISYNKLKELNINLPIDILQKRLIQLGHEVEEVNQLQIDGLILGEIVELKQHPDADTLRVCKVDIGKDVLQIVCGAPNTYVGQKVIVSQVGTDLGYIVIEKSVIRGVESNGMICALNELGYPKEKLTEADLDGIYDVDSDVKIGTNPMETLQLNDKIVVADITADRGDCQSYRGIYNDLKAILNYTENIDLPEYPLLSNVIESKATINNPYEFKVNSEYVPYFSTQLIENVKVTNTNGSDKLFLINQGFKEQNSITDISNKILVETGIPSHIYDADKIKGNITVDLTDKEEKFIGLDGKEIDVPVGTLAIRDEEKIICLAGVLGSESTKVDKNTKNILVEVGEFNPNLIFKTTKVIGKKTESSLRYEKGIDTTVLASVMNLITNSIVNNNPEAKVSNVLIENTKKREIKNITLKLANVKRILGIDIPKEEIIKILIGLNFQVNDKGDKLEVSYPYYRYDMEQENDLIEEIIRVYDIDNIPTDSTISTFITSENIIKETKYNDTLKAEDALLKSGLNEVITYSLISEKQIEDFVPNFDQTNIVKLMSPLSQEHAVYRQSLISSLIEVAVRNFAYQEKTSTIFEVANTYTMHGDEIQQVTKIAGLVAGDKQNVYQGVKSKYGFNDLKNVIEQLFAAFNIEFTVQEASEEIHGLNPYSTGEIVVNEKVIGIVGEVVFDYTKKQKEAIYVFEIDFDQLIASKPEKNKYITINNLPQIERDFTIEVDKNINYNKVASIFADLDYIKDIVLVDIYTGDNIEGDKKAITVKVIFKDDHATLTKEQLDPQIEKLYENAEANSFKINK